MWKFIQLRSHDSSQLQCDIKHDIETKLSRSGRLLMELLAPNWKRDSKTWSVIFKCSLDTEGGEAGGGGMALILYILNNLKFHILLPSQRVNSSFFYLFQKDYLSSKYLQAVYNRWLCFIPQFGYYIKWEYTWLSLALMGMVTYIMSNTFGSNIPVGNGTQQKILMSTFNIIAVYV